MSDKPMSKKELARWEEDLAVHAKQVAHNEGSDSQAFTIQHGALNYRDQPIPNNQMDVIVVASITERCYYDKPYDPDVISSPTCFAQSTDSRNLVPHENVPNKQAESCDVCPLAEFGSAKQGKGPACKTYRKIAMVPAGLEPEETAKEDIGYLKVSPTSVKNWRKYAQELVASNGVPPWAAVTRVRVVPDKKTIHQVQFGMVELIKEPEMLSVVHGRIEEAENILLKPYTYEDDEEEDVADSKY